MVAVWDWWVRIGHWLLVAAVLVAWITRHGGGSWHEWSGYIALAVVLFRVGWGFFGSPYARFAAFVKPPREVLRYARSLLVKKEAHYAGHNPLGGYMVIALLLMVALTSVSGWLYTTDRFWGIEWVGETHDFCADALMILVVLHVAGVLFSSVREGQNLVASMFHGKKRMR